MSERLSEAQVSDAFHSYLKSSLTQAKAERLLDTDLLSSAEADLMITGPALCLYFAALRCTTSPPSVPLPRSRTSVHIDLSSDNCPPPFISFLQVWSRNVPAIQSLSPEQNHDLARIICGLDPVSNVLHPQLNRIAAELRAVAIEISQRRTFQDRYASDLQAAIDGGGGVSVQASFVPPPMYDPSPSPSPNRSPGSVSKSLPPPPAPPRSEYLNAPMSPTTPSRAGSSRSVASSFAPDSPSSPSFAVDAPAIQLIRETLYASLADVISSHRHIKRLLVQDPPRAYFASVALAILDVALTRTTSEGGEVVVIGVLGAHLTLAQCPAPLRPFMCELGAIGAAARAAEEEDTMLALEILEGDAGAELPTPRMERMRRMLERGVGAEHRRRRSSAASSDSDEDDSAEEESRRRSIQGRAIALANRINALALGMTKLRAFRDRQNEVFKILAGIMD
ncbi:hypothetical protein DFH11DRAFT_1728392 [Phellopilus nigrolimitatus]|nr:hypothetical protein DFH11DRAFT_1728392 [Phellopilus nigrolimitatus]